MSFEPANGKFRGFLTMESVIASERNPEPILHRATKVYERAIARLRSLLVEIRASRANRKPIAARKIWQVGHTIFQLRDELGKLSLELDGVYNHLIRDLGVKRQWLEKAIILRRYLPQQTLIPTSLNWGRCEKGTRRVAERLRRGLPPG